MAKATEVRILAIQTQSAKFLVAITGQFLLRPSAIRLIPAARQPHPDRTTPDSPDLGELHHFSTVLKAEAFPTFT